MKILITGGAGYIGSHLVESLLLAGQECHLIDNLSRGLESRISKKDFFTNLDLCDYSAVKNYFAIHKFDIIFHLAGLMQARESNLFPQIYLKNNVIATRNLMKAIGDTKNIKMVFSSSCSVYGNNPLANENSEMNPLSTYAQTKQISERDLRLGFRNNPENLLIFRFFNVIGSLDKKDFCDIQKETLLPATARRILSDESPTIFGADYDTLDGYAIRDFIDVRDLTRALKLSFKRSLYGVHNLSAEVPVSIRRVIELLLASAQKPNLPIKIEARNQADPPIIRAKNSTELRAHGWKPRVSLEKSIQDFWRIFKEFHLRERKNAE